MRLMQIRGYNPTRAKLKHAWPPAMSTQKKLENFTSEDFAQKIEDVKVSLSLQSEDELDGVGSYLELNKDKGCLVLLQGTTTAQGADVFVVYWAEDTVFVYAIQCKNFAKYGKTFIDKGWRSLGIAVTEGDSPDIFDPEDGSAGYSYAGLDAFCNMVKCKLGKGSMVLEKRILATSVKAPPKAKVPVPLPESDTGCAAELWFREMFEPTISVVAINSPSVTTEEADPDPMETSQ